MRRDYGIYLVTDPALCGSRGVVETAREAVAGGVRIVQVRDKTATARELLAMLEAVADAVGEEARVVVNDRVDVYLAARARGARVHGVHVGQDDLPAGVVRQLVGPDVILGLTAHTPAHFAAVDALPAGTVDYLGVGAIHATATKADHPEPLGIDGLASRVHATSLPCIAIGGIRLADVAALRDAGAAGVAVVSAICATSDPTQAARALARAWARGER